MPFTSIPTTMKAAHILLGVQAALCGAKPLASDNIDVGHHVVWSYPGPTIPQELINAVKAGKAGGVIFFGMEHLPLCPTVAALVPSDKIEQERTSRMFPTYQTRSRASRKHTGSPMHIKASHS